MLFTNKKPPEWDDNLLREKTLPSCWCAGCGIGTMVNIFISAVKKAKLSPSDVCILTTGIGCTGNVTEYLKIPYYEITKDTIIDKAAQIKIENPGIKIAIFVDDADFLVYGVEFFTQVGAEGINVCIVYFNNYIYRIFMEQKVLCTEPFHEKVTDDRLQSPFNIPGLAKHCNAMHIARWTAHHPRRLENSLIYALKQQGMLSIIEVISPCLMYYPSIGKIGEIIDRCEMYQDDSIINNNEPTENLDLRFQEKIILGDFRCSED